MFGYSDRRRDAGTDDSSGRSTVSKTRGSGGVRVRVLIPLMLAMMGLIGGHVCSLYLLERGKITEESRELFRAVPDAFHGELAQEAGIAPPYDLAFIEPGGGIKHEA